MIRTRSAILDHLDHGASKEPMNPWPELINQFLWGSMISVVLDNWMGSRSRSPQRNAPILSSPDCVHVHYQNNSGYIFFRGSGFHSLNSRASSSSFWSYSFFKTSELFSGQFVVGVVASWLVRSSLEQAVRVQALARAIVLCFWARHLTLTVPLST